MRQVNDMDILPPVLPVSPKRNRSGRCSLSSDDFINLPEFYNGLEGSWVGRIPNLYCQIPLHLITRTISALWAHLFLMVTRCLENLSSGENRAVQGQVFKGLFEIYCLSITHQDVRISRLCPSMLFSVYY